MENAGSFSAWPVVIGLLASLIFIIPYVKIIRKAGYSGWWILTMFVPLLNLVMIWIFAFARWPLEERASTAGAAKVF